MKTYYIVTSNNNKTTEKLWNGNFIKVCLGNFMLFFAFYLIVPLLPLYLESTFNASKQIIGIVLSGYSLTTLLIRPFGGYIVDSYPRKKVLMICYFIFFVFFAGYIVAGTLLFFAIIRTLHGFSFGAVTVAQSTVAIDVLYPSRRAEGIGFYGLSNNVAMAIGPSIAMSIYHIAPNMDYLFMLSLISSGVGLWIVSSVKTQQKETLINKQPISLDRFILKKGWRVGLSILFYSYAFGSLSTYLAIYGKEQFGMTGGTAAYFTLLAIGLMMSRLIGSRTLRDGKITQNAAIGCSLSFIGYTLFAAIPAPWAYYSSALIIGLGNGHMYPAYQTMFINLAPHTQRGTANSTLLTSWDIGLGLGVLLGGIIAQSYNYQGTFAVAAIAQGFGVALFFLIVRGYYNTHKLR